MKVILTPPPFNGNFPLKDFFYSLCLPLVENIFNIPVINVLWQLVGGYRFNEADCEGRDVINNITKIFKNSSYMAFLPLGLIKLFNNSYFEENVKLVKNQRKYIEGNY